MKHIFSLEVETQVSRDRAEGEVLFAFAQRAPDNCRFYLKKTEEGERIENLTRQLEETKKLVQVLERVKELVNQ
jgi:hypothetical protein